jgi:L-alanine-DL-glutamate epimerase-like enolase superfamily enzyme
VARIVRFETWVCSRDESPGSGPSSRGAQLNRTGEPGSKAVLLRLTTDDGIEGYATAQVAFTPKIALAYLNEVVANVVLGRDPTDREAIWQELFWLNRRSVYFPTNLPGPVDVALWDIAAKSAGLPLYRFLGAYRSTLPVYASSQFMPEVDDYLRDAAHYWDRGIKAYKIHPSGDWRHHIEIAEALRARYPDLTLMIDPAGTYTLTEAVFVGRALERLGFVWLEEPFLDYYIGKYVELCRTLDISILASEASAGGPAGVAEFIRCGAADIVRADVLMKWGVTGTLKTMHLAEAFGLNCEPHTSGMGPMDLATLHVACSAANADWYEMLVPAESHRFPMVNSIEIDEHGYVHVPEVPGIGIDIDWGTVDNTTMLQTTLQA